MPAGLSYQDRLHGARVSANRRAVEALARRIEALAERAASQPAAERQALARRLTQAVSMLDGAA